MKERLTRPLLALSLTAVGSLALIGCGEEAPTTLPTCGVELPPASKETQPGIFYTSEPLGQIALYGPNISKPNPCSI